ncbi:hypothetical protein A2395_01085 [Candidatus Amesbacteria bacterium RIFOXYB1_FULL_47_9]|uniref:Uncharacterized protein n=1 Tax=Candidatus Amesbacteria bacterium RIFOXYB1_FULL_47_9 TaxID=1797266 RepID=A0A1F4ZVR6_9BACT|nr:MAG: hypothetical protein A2395_01085 [Candidatus Amesbacteria bacterium RIFOXYB1_FULL_47_9]
MMRDGNHIRLICESVTPAPIDTKNQVRKKSLKGLIREIICACSTVAARERPARNPPISTENPTQGEAAIAATARHQPMELIKRVSVDSPR